MNTLFHLCLAVNAAIMLSYLLSRVIFACAFYKNLPQLSQLKLLRFSFLAAILMFIMMPYFTAIHSFRTESLEFNPVIKQASNIIHISQAAAAAPLSGAKNLSLTISINDIFSIVLVISFFILSLKHFQMFLKLNKMRCRAFCLHKINNVYLLVSDTVSAPFCWSWLWRHFIIVPGSLLANHKDMRLTIRHELQHIRQGDTQWLQLLAILQLFCFWNPFLKLWRNRFNELQEFACDEELILRKKTSRPAYAQCLVNAARNASCSSILVNGVLAINGMSKSILHRRVNMLFSYRQQKRNLYLITAYIISFLAITSAAFALNGAANRSLSTREVAAIIRQSDLNKAFQIKATPEVVAEINRIRNNDLARAKMQNALKRMKQYQPYIESQLKNNNMPQDLLAIPLVESGYRPLPELNHPAKPAGLWQIIPATARNLGLVVNAQRDERMDTELSTKAALKYLTAIHEQFHDWKLAVISYEIGENETARLINATGSRDPSVIVNAAAQKYKEELKVFTAMFDADVIIMHNPSLINS